MFAILINSKTPFLSKLFISLYQDFINNNKVYSDVIILGFIRLLLININISAVFCWDFISNCYIYFNFQRGALATSSLVSSFFGSLLGSFSSGYRYSFTAMVLKLVGLLGSYTLYISPLIPSNLNRPVYLPLCPVLPLRHISTFELRGRLLLATQSIEA